MTRIPIVVLTNGTLLTRQEVRRDLAAADIVVPSLDAVPGSLFRRVNRPNKALDPEKIIDGLVRFRKEFRGEIWLEIMLIRGVNDSPAHIVALRRATDRIRPDRIQLNTVVRPPADITSKPLSPGAMRKIRDVLGPRAEIIASFEKREQAPAAGDFETAVLTAVERRPMTAEDISLSLGRHRDEGLARARADHDVHFAESQRGLCARLGAGDDQRRPPAQGLLLGPSHLRVRGRQLGPRHGGHPPVVPQPHLGDGRPEVDGEDHRPCTSASTSPAISAGSGSW